MSNEILDDDDRTPDNAKSVLRQARELVQVGPQGVVIRDLAQQIDYAKAMAQAGSTIPEHLKGNVGDCLAVIDIATRAGLSPYMVANKTYVQNKRLCFESQLYHAFIQGFGMLKGDLEVDYEGEGGDRVCIVSGILRSDPGKVRVHRSPPLRDLHPGYTLKSYDDNTSSKKSMSYADGEKLKAEGKIGEGMKLFSAGSPLWSRKPDVQQFYDTSRDWVRIYAPRAALGIFTPDEMQDYGPDFARDVTPASPGLSNRLRSGKVDRKEGNGAKDAKAEVDGAKNGETAGKKTARKKSAAPKNPAEWEAYARDHISAATDAAALTAWWPSKSEIDLRNACGVVSEQRKPVEDMLNKRIEELEAREKSEGT